jgi:hypothetical protein
MAKRGPKVQWTDDKLDELADAMVAFYEENPDAKFIEDFTSANGIWRQRLSEWALKNEKLADARKRIDDITASRVANMGLNGGANPTFAIFALKQKGWKDQQDVALSGSIGISSLAQALTDA